MYENIKMWWYWLQVVSTTGSEWARANKWRASMTPACSARVARADCCARAECAPSSCAPRPSRRTSPARAAPSAKVRHFFSALDHRCKRGFFMKSQKRLVVEYWYWSHFKGCSLDDFVLKFHLTREKISYWNSPLRKKYIFPPFFNF